MWHKKTIKTYTQLCCTCMYKHTGIRKGGKIPKVTSRFCPWNLESVYRHYEFCQNRQGKKCDYCEKRSNSFMTHLRKISVHLSYEFQLALTVHKYGHIFYLNTVPYDGRLFIKIPSPLFLPRTPLLTPHKGITITNVVSSLHPLLSPPPPPT